MLSLLAQLDVNLRIMDAGGQHYFDFLKPMLMQGRALVLLCVCVGEEPQWVEQLREHMDVLSTLMEGGLVIPVITKADLLPKGGEERVLELWTSQVVPLLQRYASVLDIETLPTLVSSKDGRGVGAVVARLREGVCKVFLTFLFSCLLFFLSLLNSSRPPPPTTFLPATYTPPPPPLLFLPN